MGRRALLIVIGLVFGWVGSAQSQILRVETSNQEAGRFETSGTSGDEGIALTALRAEILDTGVGNRVAVSGNAQLGDAANVGVFGFAASETLFYGLAYGVLGQATCGVETCTDYAVFALGDLGYTGSLLQVSASLPLAHSLVPLGSALSKLLDLEVVSYEHVQTEEVEHMNLPEGRQVGFVTQQVAQVLPGLVTEAASPPAGWPRVGSHRAEPIRYQALKTTDLIPYLVRAVQEQQAEIEALKAQLEPLQNRLAELTPDPLSGLRQPRRDLVGRGR